MRGKVSALSGGVATRQVVDGLVLGTNLLLDDAAALALAVRGVSVDLRGGHRHALVVQHFHQPVLLQGRVHRLDGAHQLELQQAADLRVHRVLQQVHHLAVVRAHFLCEGGRARAFSHPVGTQKGGQGARTHTHTRARRARAEREREGGRERGKEREQKTEKEGKGER